MKEVYKAEKDQWIPREISYSLKQVSRINKNGDPITSKSNALLAVVIPDSSGSYNYYVYNKTCCTTGCRCFKNYTLFYILRKNMFNIKEPDTEICDDGSTIYYGDSSYTYVVKWEDFIADMDTYINRAYNIRDNIDNYDVHKEVD